MPRRARRRRRVVAMVAALLVLLAVLGGLLLLVARVAGESTQGEPALRFEGAGDIRIVGTSTESAWWMTPRVTKGPSGSLIVSIPAPVLFAVGSARLGSGAVPTIDEVVSLLALRPGSNIAADCFTDATGTPAFNRALSDARAQAVAAALEADGVPTGAITATGFGSTDFVATNATPTGRALNRRCSLTVVGAPSPAPPGT
jgi:outer membrane protein OmpA-like peptidoglycan-associated protein